MGIIHDTRLMKVESVYAKPEMPNHPVRYDIRLAPVVDEASSLNDSAFPVRVTEWDWTKHDVPKVGEVVKVSAWNFQWNNVTEEGGEQVIHLRGMKHLKAA